MVNFFCIVLLMLLWMIGAKKGLRLVLLVKHNPSTRDDLPFLSSETSLMFLWDWCSVHPSCFAPPGVEEFKSCLSHGGLVWYSCSSQHQAHEVVGGDGGMNEEYGGFDGSHILNFYHGWSIMTWWSTRVRNISSLPASYGNRERNADPRNVQKGISEVSLRPLLCLVWKEERVSKRS